MSVPKITAIIPAAGRSARMGVPKPLLKWKGRSFLEIIVRLLTDRDVAALVVHRRDQDLIAALVTDMQQRGLDVSGTFNPLQDSEMVDSVALGVEELSSRHPDWNGVLVWPADCPAVSSTDLDRVLKAIRRHSNRIVVPTWNGQGGHPTYFPKIALTPLLHATLPYPGSLRSILERALDPLQVPATSKGVVLNLNDPDTLRELLRIEGSPTRAG